MKSKFENSPEEERSKDLEIQIQLQKDPENDVRPVSCERNINSCRRKKFCNTLDGLKRDCLQLL